jgi:hypothetical protein
MENITQEDTVGTGSALVNFGAAINALKNGKMVARIGWNGKGMFVFREVPAQVPAVIVPKMSSLPDAVKAEFEKRGGNLWYSNQFAIVKADNTINGWAPSGSDTLAEDWIIL